MKCRKLEKEQKHKINMKNKKEVVLYIIFGIATTLVNIVTYYILQALFQVPYLIANAAAWFFSVLFAFVTNKIFVFEQRTWNFEIVSKEISKFFSARIATGILDMLLMWLFVSVFSFSEMLMKVVVNGIVILLNYLLSKWIVFH